MIKKLRFLVLAVILFTPIINANAELFLDAIVATINDKPITLSDINKKYNKHLTYDDLKNNLQASKIVDTAILDTIVELEGQKKRLSVSDKELDSYISQIANKNSLTVPAFKEELKKQNISFKNYKEQIRSDILKSKIASNIIRNGAAVTDEEINSYIKKVNENNLLNSKISLNQICILKGNKTEAESLKILKDILEALKNDDFKEVAKKYSETPDAKNGGYLGEFELNELSNEIFNAISQLSENEVSKIIDTENAYYIFQVAKKDATKKPTEEEKRIIKAKLEEEHLKDAINSYFSKEIYKNYSIDKKF